MQKKSKTILTAVVTALFMLSISYFALLAPTTAWYYEKEDKSFSFTFGNFSMGKPTPQNGESQSADIVLRGTTRFADAGEVLFDEMTHVIKLTASNAAASEMTGSVGVNVKLGGTVLDVDNTSGLKWFVCEAPTAPATVKDSINAMLTAKNSSWPLDYKAGDFSTYAGTSLEEKYESYNTQAIAALKEYDARGISVAPGQTKSIYIVFWAEYGELKSEFEVESEPADRTITTKYYRGPAIEGSTPVTYEKLSIEVFAAPDTGGTQTATLTIASAPSHDLATTVKLYQWRNVNNTWGWVLYTGAYNTYTGANDNNGSSQTTGDSGDISVPTSGGSAQITGLSVGTRFKLELAQASPARFDGTGTDVETNEDGTVITGTISNAGSTVTLGSQTQTVVISGKDAAAATNVKVYYWQNNAWTVYAGMYQTRSGSTWSADTSVSDGELVVPAGGAARVTFPSNTARYKLEITTSSPTVHFNDSSNATQIIGAVGGISEVVSIVPNA